MKRVRIRDIAKKLNVKTGCITTTLKDLGIKKHPNASIDTELAKKVLHLLKSKHYTNGKEPKTKGRDPLQFEVTEDTMRKYASLGLTKEAIADLHGMSSRSLRRRFKENPNWGIAYNMGWTELKTAWHQTIIRRALGRKDEDGNYTERPVDRVLIYMGKAFFNMTEKMESADQIPKEKIAEQIVEAQEQFAKRGFK